MGKILFCMLPDIPQKRNLSVLESSRGAACPLEFQQSRQRGRTGAVARVGRSCRGRGRWMGKRSEKADVKHCLGDDKDHDIIGMAVDGEEEKPFPLWGVIQSGTDHYFLVLEGHLDLAAY
jgi:hypothetical protein